MRYYELIKNYGHGKNEAVMWEATKRVDMFIESVKGARYYRRRDRQEGGVYVCRLSQ